MMKVLLGEFNGNSAVMPYLKRHGWGRMWASYGPDWDYDDEPWGFDNGAWAAFANGTEFDATKFKRRMATAVERSHCRSNPLVPVVPDIVAGGMGSLAMSERWLSSGDLVSGWGWYLAVQDGMCHERVRRVATHFDCSGLFLGGSDEFKRTAPFWCAFAHTHDMKFHYARCNRESWIRTAIEIGADSIDTTRPVRAFTGGEMGKFRLFEQLVTGKCAQQNFFALH